MIKTLQGLQLEISGNDHPIVDSLRETGMWEPKTTKFIKDNLKKGQVFYDIGANVGYFSLLASKLVGGRGTVYSFEPNPENIKYLEKNIKTNKLRNITVTPKAVMDVSGNVELRYGVSPGQTGISGAGAKFSVDSVAIDDLKFRQPDFIKIDVEGSEMNVLRGMEKLLGTDKELTIIVESFNQDAVEFLVDRGFKIITTEREAGNYMLVKNQKDVKAKKEPITFHMLGTFQTPTNKKEGIGYAFCTKIMHISKTLRSLGHKVIFYGAEGSEVECDEFVQVLSKSELPVEVWKNKYVEDSNHPANKLFNKRCIEEINKRKSKYFVSKDVLLIPTGLHQKPVADAVKLELQVELGIGYAGVFAKYKIFESYNWMHWHYGKANETMGHFYDAVIPPIFDPKEFEYKEEKEDYFLFIGRITEKKGVRLAKQVCDRVGVKLKIAGIDCGMKDLESENVEIVGFADAEKRKDLISKARAVIMPTLYIEPFGYVLIESAMSGTPIITSDFGSFPSIVKDGETGFRCRNFAEFCWAVKNIDKIKPKNCRKWAMNFTQKKIAPFYENYFQQMQNLFGKGFYSLIDKNYNFIIKK